MTERQLDLALYDEQPINYFSLEAQESDDKSALIYKQAALPPSLPEFHISITRMVAFVFEIKATIDNRRSVSYGDTDIIIDMLSWHEQNKGRSDYVFADHFTIDIAQGLVEVKKPKLDRAPSATEQLASSLICAFLNRSRLDEEFIDKIDRIYDEM